MIRFNRQPEAAKRALNSFSVRSFPPEKSIIDEVHDFRRIVLHVSWHNAVND